jgi:hypothetical protein
VPRKILRFLAVFTFRDFSPYRFQGSSLVNDDPRELSRHGAYGRVQLGVLTPIYGLVNFATRFEYHSIPCVFVQVSSEGSLILSNSYSSHSAWMMPAPMTPIFSCAPFVFVMLVPEEKTRKS